MPKVRHNNTVFLTLLDLVNPKSNGCDRLSTTTNLLLCQVSSHYDRGCRFIVLTRTLLLPPTSSATDTSPYQTGSDDAADTRVHHDEARLL